MRYVPVAEVHEDADQIVAVDVSVLVEVGRGERDLKVATGDNADNAANRRVEVIVR